MKNENFTRSSILLAWGVAFIIAVVPFHAFFTSWAANNLGHLDALRLWKEYILLVLTPLSIAVGLRNRETKKYLLTSSVVRLFVTFVLLHILLGAWALHTGEVNKKSLGYAFVINLRYIAFFIISYIAASNYVWLKQQSAKLLYVPAVIVVAIGLLQKITMSHNLLGYFYGKGTIPPYQTIDGNDQLRRVQSTLRGANPLGTYLVLSITAFIAFIRNRLWRISLLAGSLLVLFYSYSRGAWIGTAVSLWLLSWWMLLKSHHRLWIAGTIIAIAVIGAGGFYALQTRPSIQDELLHTSSSSKSKISSNASHRTSLITGVEDVIHHPLGRGPGTAGPASYRNKPHPTRIAENYYVQIAQEVGIIGLAILLAINVLVAKYLWNLRDNPLSKVLLASFIGISLINMLSHAWTDDTIAYIWWGMAGICLAPAIITDKRKQKNAKKTKN